MLRNLTLKVLRDRRLALLGWGLGLAGLIALILMAYPVVASATGVGSYVEKLPPIFLVLLGETDILSPAGFINAELFNFLIPFVLISCAVGTGVEVLAGNIERRTLDLLLATPLSRTRFTVQSFLAIAGVVFTLGVFVFVGLLIGTSRAEIPVQPLHLAGATVSACLNATCFGTLALVFGSFLSRRGPTMALTAGCVTLTFFLNSVGSLFDFAEPFRRVSPFFYYRLGDPVRNGASLANLGGLTAISLLLLALATFQFRRRDLA